LWEEIFGNE
jgi:Ca2+-binding EF-hand superfamily protein